MAAEIGQICLVIALALAVIQFVLPLIGAQIGNRALMATARPAAHGQFLFLLFSFIILTNAFIEDDFSVLYVANNSNTELPLAFKFAAVWGAHEGSLLLWALILGVWTSAVALFSRSLPAEMVARVLGVMGSVAAGFTSFILFTSNPFDRIFPMPAEGGDLNPLLQDFAMLIHPPTLYMGYVGVAVPFAFAVAATAVRQRLDKDWARWTRPWTTGAWLFLTASASRSAAGGRITNWAGVAGGSGIRSRMRRSCRGSMATALIHSLAVTEKRGIFKSSTLLLAIATFSLSLLGTFLVRSGVLVSVHAFASDPARGMFILIFLGLVVGTSLTLYAWRAGSLETNVGFKPLSRETFLLLNNILLVIATGVILVGTLGPLIFSAFDLGSISVGPEYFEISFLLPMLPLVLFVGVGMHATWRSADPATLFRKLRWPALGSVLLGVAVPWVVFGETSLLTALGVVIGFWTVASALIDPAKKVTGKGPRFTRSMIAMQMAHFGLGITILGITVTSSFSIETDEGMRPGDTKLVSGYAFTFEGTRNVSGPNYDAIQGVFSVSRDGEAFTELLPEKRIYRVQTNPMTEAGIQAEWGRDIFVALGESLGEGAWSVRIQYKPLIRFIWFGCLIMAIGGVVAVTDPRYRQGGAQA